jgi:hypothetical protein
MERYFAYENWRADGHRVTVHLAHCPFCNDGSGLAGGTSAQNGQWLLLGTQSTPENALEAARRRVRAPKITLCGSCLKKRTH